MSGDTPSPPKTYRLHAPDSSEADAILAKQGLTRARLEHVLAELARTGDVDMRTIIGINDDGVFGSGREDWAADLPDAFKEPLIAVPWGRILARLGLGREEDHPAG